MIELDLRDIHLPDTLLWWPPAPGWWLLTMLLVMLVVITWWLLRSRRNHLRQTSLQELASIREAYLAGVTERHIVADIGALLRRIVISYYGRPGTAGMTGKDWQIQVTKLSRGSAFSETQLDLLSHARYRRDPDYDVEQLLRASESWVRGLPRGRSHVST